MFLQVMITVLRRYGYNVSLYTIVSKISLKAKNQNKLNTCSDKNRIDIEIRSVSHIVDNVGERVI